MDTAILPFIAQTRSLVVALSEPVDEVSRSFGFGIMNGLNLARTVTDLVRGMNAEDRSRLESELRIRHSSELHAARMDSITAEEDRNQQRHQIGMRQRQREIAIADEDVARRNLDSVHRNAREERETAARVGSTYLQNQLRVAEFGLKSRDSTAENARRERATNAQVDASKARENTARTEEQIKREDQSRRIGRESKAERREEQLHANRLAAHNKREARADELHDLEKAAIRQQMELRARTAGLTQTLTGNQQGFDKAMAAAGRFAAANSTADPTAGDAFSERFRDDTGLDPSQFDAALHDLGDLGADPVEALAKLLENAQNPDADPATLLAARYLTNLLTTETDPGLDEGAPIGEAVAAANAAAHPAADAELEADPADRTSGTEQVAASEVGP
ncbi:hypothetical protein AB0346_09955 [Nocardia beijingensis]|uniref:hypothetical protein n=1 Tax=Nocardia beijingensis TaxID=95162 RepID=UPI0034502B1C